MKKSEHVSRWPSARRARYRWWVCGLLALAFAAHQAISSAAPSAPHVSPEAVALGASAPHSSTTTQAASSLNQDDVWWLLKATVATARYRNVKRAIADGYVSSQQCFSSPDGAMGVHFLRADLMNDAVVKPEQPEILLYIHRGGRMRLVGVEYFEPDLGQKTPTLFGQAFDGPMPGHWAGMPVHYDLHVWLWHYNPSGLFYKWNPTLTCQALTQDPRMASSTPDFLSSRPTRATKRRRSDHAITGSASGTTVG